jgi:hypothetical protein
MTYLSSAELDQVLDPVDNTKGTVRVPLADVACSEPAVFGKDTSVIVQVVALEVAFRHCGPADPDLA